jgi:phosphoribosylglycinamide formyltransferase-1
MPNKKRILLLASGAGSLAKAIFEAYKSGALDIDIIGVISDKDAPVLALAKEYDVNSYLISMQSDRDEWDRTLLAQVSELNPDLIVSVGFMRILSAQFVKRFKVINTHPALLPNFPGAHAVRDALAAGVSETGTTVHWVDEGVDTGEVINQVKVPIIPSDSEEVLHERIKIAERVLIVETLHKYAQTGSL